MEINRGRREARAFAGFSVLPTQTGFPFATYAAKVSRAWDVPGRKDEGHYEQVWLLASHTHATAQHLLVHNRLYWGIEDGLHQRLDCSRLDEDRSRVRTPDNLLNLAMFRRMAVTLAIARPACAWASAAAFSSVTRSAGGSTLASAFVIAPAFFVPS